MLGTHWAYNQNQMLSKIGQILFISHFVLPSKVQYKMVPSSALIPHQKNRVRDLSAKNKYNTI